jgi:hypothetical protein
MMEYNQDAGKNCFERSDKTVHDDLCLGLDILDLCCSRSNDAPASPGINVSGRTIWLKLSRP